MLMTFWKSNEKLMDPAHKLSFLIYLEQKKLLRVKRFARPSSFPLPLSMDNGKNGELF